MKYPFICKVINVKLIQTDYKISIPLLRITKVNLHITTEINLNITMYTKW